MIIFQLLEVCPDDSMSIEFAEKSNLFFISKHGKQEASNKPADEYICEIKFEEFPILLKKQKRLILFFRIYFKTRLKVLKYFGGLL